MRKIVIATGGFVFGVGGEDKANSSSSILKSFYG